MSDEKTYVFLSFASAHTGKNLGCCALDCDPIDANEKAKELGLMPNECNQARAYVTDKSGIEGMELGVFYTSEQMSKMGFEKC